MSSPSVPLNGVYSESPIPCRPPVAAQSFASRADGMCAPLAGNAATLSARLGSVSRSASVRAMTQVAALETPDTLPMETRIVGAAVELFARRGIDATSLQMIADALGITKGAVYYHFKTKHEIVLAVCADSFDALEAAVVEAETIESVTSRERALDHLVPRLVAQAVESRSVFSKLRFDPVMVRLMADDARYEDLLARLDRLLGGDGPDAEAMVRTAAAISALAGAPVHHLVAGLDDTALRAHLTTVLRETVR